MSKKRIPDHFKSKKFVSFVTGCIITVLFTIMALLFIAFVPSVSASIVNLITVALASINGMISIYALGQSAVDWQIQSKNKNENKSEFSRKEIEKIMTVDYE